MVARKMAPNNNRARDCKRKILKTGGKGRETRTYGRRSEEVELEDVAVNEPMFLTGDERAGTGVHLGGHLPVDGAFAPWR